MVVPKFMPFITEFMLLRRIETMLIANLLGNKTKMEMVVKNTINTIKNYEVSDVHQQNLDAYVKNIEFALLMTYLDVPESAKEHLHMAADVIERDLAAMTPAYIMYDRMNTFEADKIGTLAVLPNDIITHIANMVTCK